MFQKSVALVLSLLMKSNNNDAITEQPSRRNPSVDVSPTKIQQSMTSRAGIVSEHEYAKINSAGKSNIWHVELGHGHGQHSEAMTKRRN